MAKALKKHSARGRGTSSESPSERALDAIEPSEHERDRCRGKIAKAVEELTYCYANPEEFAGFIATLPDRKHESTKRIADIAQAVGHAAVVMKANDLMQVKMPVLIELVRLRSQRQPKSYKALLDEWGRLIDDLASIARAAEQLLAGRKKTTKPPDEFKHWCARVAFMLLRDFNPHRATLNDNFVELAQILYEAATGKADEPEPFYSMCREEIRQRRRWEEIRQKYKFLS